MYLYISIISKRILRNGRGRWGTLVSILMPGSEKQNVMNKLGRKKYQMGEKWTGKISTDMGGNVVCATWV